MPSSAGNGIISGINVTPLVDIMLVLLVVFMVTTTVVATPAVPLDLPQARHVEDTQVVLSVVLPAAGGTLIDGEPVADDQAFVRRTRAVSVRDAQLRAVIDADGAVPHRRVLHTLDLLKTAGVARVAFGARPAEVHTP